jgi:DNA-binding response OmpR family regulator
MRQTLLIADDDAELCELYRRFLTERGYEVETSSDGLDCMRKLRQMRPTVLVLDLELRWGGGDGVLAWLREENLISGIPVVLTAKAGYPLDTAGFKDPPVVDYLPKPFALSALLESVRSAGVLNGSQMAPYLHREPAYSELFIG